MMLFVLIFFVLLVVLASLYVNLHPTFGGNTDKDQKKTYHTFNNFQNGKFVNQVPTNMNMSMSTILSLLKDSMKGNKDRKPKEVLSVTPLVRKKINSKEDFLTWFGHSTFLLGLDGKKILIDPMFGPSPSPVSFLGSKRYSEEILSVIDDLPFIDTVFITHDHYDHLDYRSIMSLKGKVGHFFVPHGVGVHLLRWGVSREKITEMNWWDEVEWEGITVSAVPSQHFSGRGLRNRDSSLWVGWVLLGKKNKLYISGDGGYGHHFKQIGEKYGPFDLTLIEGGQYDRRWSEIHMKPEDSVQAHLDVKGKYMMLTHWGAFTLAHHSWTDPIERALIKAKEKEVNMITPKIGEVILLDEINEFPTTSWWDK